MYQIVEADSSPCAAVCHGEDVFRKAHRLGEDRIHVLNPAGRNYDLLYVENRKYRPGFVNLRWPEQNCYPDYRNYDETEEKSLYLSYLNRFDSVQIEEVNEYSVILSRVFLRFTDARIFCRDERMSWFCPDGVEITEEFPEIGGSILRIAGLEQDREFDPEFTRLGPIGAFHNVFFLQGQGMIHGRDYAYAEVLLDEKAGIGSILINLSRLSRAFESVGLPLVSQGESIGHFDTDFLNHYFSFDLRREGASSENILTFPETSTLAATWFLLHTKPAMDRSILKDRFRWELEEYAEAVIADRKMLGVLIRGTDYLLVYQSGERRMASVAEMVPMIREWIGKYGYEGIFLATEDQDVMDQMRSEFGSGIKVVVQERHRLSELKENMLLSDLERESAGDYRYTVIEDTVNYFYALYLLSRCDGFLCSGMCNGYEMVMSLNEGQFKKVHVFRDGK